jgi:methionine-gamma-lyase
MDENEAGPTGTPQKRPPRPSPTHIGNHKLSPSTLMMGYGFDPELSEGSLKPPIFLTSTFVFENAAAGKRFFEGRHRQAPGRRRRADLFALQRAQPGDPGGPAEPVGECRRRAQLSRAECRRSRLSSSPSASPATSWSTRVRSTRRPKPSSPRSFGKFGVTYVDFPAGATREEIDSVIEKAKGMGRVALIYLESPANPTNALVDVEAVVAAAKGGVRPGRQPADRNRQHFPRASCGQSRSSRAPTSQSTA